MYLRGPILYSHCMSVYMVEAYRSRVTETATAAPEDLSRAADQLTEEGTPVHLVHAVFVPHDEWCFYLFEAESSDAVSEVARRCDLPYERLVEACARWTRSAS
jgi:hypothetical protein